MNEETIDMDILSSRIKSFELPLYSYEGTSNTLFSKHRVSAVLVPLFLKDSVPYVLLTKRSSNLRRHAGEVACPGGMKDECDLTEVDTALREAEEEIGLKCSDVRIIARIPPRVTRHKVVIYPVVGIIPNNFLPSVNKEEVESVFSLPLSRFLSSDGHDSGEFNLGKGQAGSFHIFTDTIDGRIYKTWGLTANIIIELAVAVLQKKPEFVFDLNTEVSPDDPFAAQHFFLESFYNFPKNRL